MLDEARLHVIYNEHYQLLYSIGRLFLGADEKQAASVEDAIQDTFLLLWEKRRKLEKHPNLSGWLVETMRKKLQSAMSKSSRRANRHAYSLDSLDADLVSLSSEAFPYPEEFVLDQSRAEALEMLLGPEDAALFQKYFMQNMAAKDLAKLLAVSPDCVRMRASRLRKKVLANKEIFFGIVALLFVRF